MEKFELEAHELRERIRDEMLDERGREIPDPMPMAPPLGYKPQKSMFEQMRDMIRSEHVRLAAMEAGMETFEEADDFDTGEDDEDAGTPYEEVFDPVDEDVRRRLRQEEYSAKFEERLAGERPVKEKDNGGAKRDADEGGSGSSESRSRESDKERKDDSGKK